MISKVGKQDYLGIEIDYSREDDLNTFSTETLKDRYLWEDENSCTRSLRKSLSLWCNVSRLY